MKQRLLLTVVGILFLALIAGCSKSSDKNKNTSAENNANNMFNYTAKLVGANEVPDSVVTNAAGEALFQFNSDTTELNYKINVSDIDSVSMAHIHYGTSQENGPILVWLYPSTPPPQVKPGTFSGVLAKGTITAANLQGPLKGKSIADLMKVFDSDSAYVNIHNQKHPDGVIRGQIQK